MKLVSSHTSGRTLQTVPESGKGWVSAGACARRKFRRGMDFLHRSLYQGVSGRFRHVIHVMEENEVLRLLCQVVLEIGVSVTNTGYLVVRRLQFVLQPDVLEVNPPHHVHDARLE